MELREIELSIKLPDIIHELQLFIYALKNFSWTRSELNQFLLARAEKLFDVPKSSEKVRVNIRKHKKIEFMRGVHNQQYVRKRSIKNYIVGIFVRPKSKYRRRHMANIPIAKRKFKGNVLRKRE
jgi:hypothetical protein